MPTAMLAGATAPIYLWIHRYPNCRRASAIAAFRAVGTCGPTVPVSPSQTAGAGFPLPRPVPHPAAGSYLVSTDD
jgi:hypothetical protein